MTQVPFFRADITDAEIQEVVATLRSGWLTTGPKVRQFEESFAEYVGAAQAVALNSATAALHLALEALNLKAGEGVLVPAMTFASTAEVVRYFGAIPILVDCERSSLNLDLNDASSRLAAARAGRITADGARDIRVVGIIPVHVGGAMMDMHAVQAFASREHLWVVEDAAHAFPGAWRPNEWTDWIPCGRNTAAVTCFSFYANKTITTGEGGMAVTSSPDIADRIRLMSLHGLSRDAWSRYGGGSWDYRIIAPGFKYNLTDIAAAIGIHQLARAEEMRSRRERIAAFFYEALANVDEIELPPQTHNRIHSWHLFPIRLRLPMLSISRDEFIEALRREGIGTSVHWRPLHLHPYYRDTFGWKPSDLPVATEEWMRLISLPIYPSMTSEEMHHVVFHITALCVEYARRTVTK
jgi:dTDP-4-amino-4,6-dideoxygalactose transaminase